MTITIKEEHNKYKPNKIMKGDILISDSIYLVLSNNKDGLTTFDLKFNSIDTFKDVEEFEYVFDGIDKVISSENYSIIEN